jgi:hypothetical protein
MKVQSKSYVEWLIQKAIHDEFYSMAQVSVKDCKYKNHPYVTTMLMLEPGS